MKNVVVVVIIAFAVAIFTGNYALAMSNKTLAKSGLTIKGGFDTMGESEADFEYDGSTTSDTGDVKMGISFSAEGVLGISDTFGIGAGVTYQVPRAVDEDWPEGKFNYINGYGILNVCIPMQNSNINPFLVVHVGYGHAMGNGEFKESLGLGSEVDLKGGIYWGLGGGILFQNGIQLELLYNVNNGSAEVTDGVYEGATVDQKYSKLTISVGYVF